ncbi:MAG: hypothetical protein H0W12_01440 [Chitinophagaceae bacterium]|nr:hypothetical protein [Chitinophagaceae bacterium]
MKTSILLLLAAFTGSLHSIGQNVGIGTTTPNHPLTVVSTSDGIVSKSGTVEVGTWVNSGGGAYLQTYSNHPLNFATGNSIAQMTLLTNGNFGIGTSNPSAKLEVNGNLKITDGTQGANKVLTSDASGNTAWQNASFSAPDRFLQTFSISGGARNYTTNYNNGTAFSITNEIVTINKTGLYHFESAVSLITTTQIDVTQQSANPNMLELRLIVNNAPNIGNNIWFELDYKPFFQPAGGSFSSQAFVKGSQDLYIQAPATITFFYYSNNFANFSTSGYSNYFSGYLIAP